MLKKHFSLLSMWKTVFLWKLIIFFRILQWTEMSDNNIINVFTVTFNQFNAPLNKIYLFNELFPKPLTGTVQFKCKSLLVAVLFSSWNHLSFLSFFNVILFFCFCVSHYNYKQMPKITNYISSFHFIIPSDVHSSLSFIPCLFLKSVFSHRSYCS